MLGCWRKKKKKGTRGKRGKKGKKGKKSASRKKSRAEPIRPKKDPIQRPVKWRVDEADMYIANPTNIHLVVDDNSGNRYVLKRFLARKGITTEEASDGEDALRVLRGKSSLGYFDVIWVDVRMLPMDGLEFTKLAREDGYAGPMIGVTGNVGDGWRNRAFDAGMSDVMAKPIIKNEFFRHPVFKNYHDSDSVGPPSKSIIY